MEALAPDQDADQRQMHDVEENAGGEGGAYQALDDYLDAADCEDDDADAAAYREEAIKWAKMLCALGLLFWRPDGSCYWLALRLYNRLADAAAAK